MSRIEIKGQESSALYEYAKFFNVLYDYYSAEKDIHVVNHLLEVKETLKSLMRNRYSATLNDIEYAARLKLSSACLCGEEYNRAIDFLTMWPIENVIEYINKTEQNYDDFFYQHFSKAQESEEVVCYFSHLKKKDQKAKKDQKLHRTYRY